MNRQRLLKELKCSVETGLVEKRTISMKNQLKMRIIVGFIQASTSLVQNALNTLIIGILARRVDVLSLELGLEWL